MILGCSMEDDKNRTTMSCDMGMKIKIVRGNLSNQITLWDSHINIHKQKLDDDEL